MANVTYEVKVIFTLSEEESNKEEFQKFKNSILSGEFQRGMKDESTNVEFQKVTATIIQTK